MTYSIKSKKEKNIDSYNEKELALLRKKYKGKLPPLIELYRESARLIYKVPERTHKKGNLVQFQEQPAIIDKVTKNGIYVRPVQTIDKPVSRKTYYISNEEVREGKIDPYITFYPA
jgi:hypothetical protein